MISLLVRVLLSVAIADGRLKGVESTTIKTHLVELGADPSRASKLVKACVEEIRGGVEPRDFVADALAQMKPFQGTPFGADVLRFQQAVATSDGNTSAAEQKILDAFESQLAGQPGNVEQNTRDHEEGSIPSEENDPEIELGISCKGCVCCMDYGLPQNAFHAFMEGDEKICRDGHVLDDWRFTFATDLCDECRNKLDQTANWLVCTPGSQPRGPVTTAELIALGDANNDIVLCRFDHLQWTGWRQRAGRYPELGQLK